MSTKIYDAYKYNGDLNSLMDKLKSFRSKAREHFTESLGGLLHSDFKFLEVSKELKKEALSGMRSPLNFESSIGVFFHPKIDGFLVKFFGMENFKNYERRLPKSFKDWYYQNSSDRPDKISEPEWRQREKEWDLIFKDCGIYQEAGLIFVIYDAGNVDRMVWDLVEKRRNKSKLEEKTL